MLLVIVLIKIAGRPLALLNSIVSTFEGCWQFTVVQCRWVHSFEANGRSSKSNGSSFSGLSLACFRSSHLAGPPAKTLNLLICCEPGDPDSIHAGSLWRRLASSFNGQFIYCPLTVRCFMKPECFYLYLDSVIRFSRDVCSFSCPIDIYACKSISGTIYYIYDYLVYICRIPYRLLPLVAATSMRCIGLCVVIVVSLWLFSLADAFWYSDAHWPMPVRLPSILPAP